MHEESLAALPPLFGVTLRNLDMQSAREVVNDSLKLLKNSEVEKALSLVDDAITRAAAAGRPEYVRILARHAGVVSTHHGQLRRAERHYKKVLEYYPDDASAFVA